MSSQLPIAGSSLARTKAERPGKPSHGRPSQRKAESGQNHPYKREKAPEGLLVTRAPWGPHSAGGRTVLRTVGSGGDVECVPKGSAD